MSDDGKNPFNEDDPKDLPKPDVGDMKKPDIPMPPEEAKTDVPMPPVPEPAPELSKPIAEGPKEISSESNSAPKLTPGPPKPPVPAEPDATKVMATPAVPIPPPPPRPAGSKGLDGIEEQRIQQRRAEEELERDEELRSRDRKLLLTGAGIAAVIAIIIGFGLMTFLPPTIDTTELEDNSVTTPKIFDGAVTKEKLAPDSIDSGPTGATGPKGPTGPEGPIGATGKKGKGVSGFEVIREASPIDSNIAKSFNLNCPEGKKIVGGGAEIIGGNESVALASSLPTEEGTAWSARAIEIEDFNQSWSISISVSCAKISK